MTNVHIDRICQAVVYDKIFAMNGRYINRKPLTIVFIFVMITKQQTLRK